MSSPGIEGLEWQQTIYLQSRHTFQKLGETALELTTVVAWSSIFYAGWHRFIKPKAIHDKDVVDEYAKDYMYLACIKFVNSIKTASLRWHSPMLDDISAVKTWDKVNSGMIKMYRVEVLGKLPVAQHFLFTPLLPFPESAVDAAKIAQDASVHVDDHGHVHVKGEGFGDCCGIPIPSAFAAARAEQAKGLPSIPMSSNVRVIPFD
ncbi:Serine/threonine-protein phosphatase 2A activator 2 [Cystobasidiomycetes sp. EMM_F5]